MKVIITGGGGFLGSRLAVELARRRELVWRPDGERREIEGLALVDLVVPEAVRGALAEAPLAIEVHEGDVAEPALLREALPIDPAVPVAVFHLASVVSGGAEADFDRAMRVNLDATRALLELLRQRSGPRRLVFTSSVATFGGHAMTPCVSDRTKQIPQGTYGMTKLISELLINDYARKGFVDGRGARLPTVFVRPGRPNAAASSFASGVIREPLKGETCALPVARSQQMPLLSYGKVIEGLITLLEADAARLGDDRTINFPSATYTVAEMIAALEAVAVRRGIALGPIVDAPDAAVRALVESWPVATEFERATALGIEGDTSLEDVIERYLADFG